MLLLSKETLVFGGLGLLFLGAAVFFWSQGFAYYKPRGQSFQHVTRAEHPGEFAWCVGVYAVFGLLLLGLAFKIVWRRYRVMNEFIAANHLNVGSQGGGSPSH